MFYRDLLDEEGNEIQYGNRYFHIGIIFVFIVVESLMIGIVRILLIAALVFLKEGPI